MAAAADSWSALLPGQEFVPAYLISRFAAQYRVVVDVLLAEQDTSLTSLSYDEVAAEVCARPVASGRLPGQHEHPGPVRVLSTHEDVELAPYDPTRPVR